MISYVCGYGYHGYQIPNFQTSNMSVAGVFPTGAYPNGLAYSSDDKYVYAAHSVYPTAVDVYDTTTYQYLGQFAIPDRCSLMTVDASGKNLFVSPNGTYFSNTNVCVYSIGVVPEPSTLILLGIGVIGMFGYGWRRLKDKS
jgi:DNA-binding beta-propeller fold protein YncE